MKVLVLEPGSKERTLITQALERGGHEILAAEDGEQAWKWIEAGEARFVIADADSGEVRKADLIARARAAKINHVYFLLLSGSEKDDEQVPATADDVLHKPFSASELKARIGVGERILAMADHLSQARDQLENLALYDPLTGLMNHSAFFKVAQGELERARRSSSPLSMIAIDIDHFKSLNDSHGVQAGDEVLKAVAAAIREKSRPYDCLGRWTGDEFLIALPGVIGPDAEKVTDRIIKGIQTLSISAADDTELKVQASAGIASASRISAATEVEPLIQQARQAMSRAKEAGGNQVYLTYV
jgi:diguanylate cyclase (GGDEF)-like protein